jgi:hypothetical protein
MTNQETGQKMALLAHNARAYAEMLTLSAKELNALATVLEIQPDAEAENAYQLDLILKAALKSFRFIATDVRVTLESLNRPI